ncbi:MAG: hypothetical protein B6244_07485 [Candidatus Cloacimonetes bacterium 4572_55]|nr:MAG: hypothetical protein B6244_07485 [Candidatus Cloacimonetes bacterium 4572_55]
MHEKIDGRITPGKKKELRAHMNDCIECRQEYYQLKVLVEYLLKTPIEKIPPDFMDNVMMQVRIPTRYRIRDRILKWISRIVLRPAVAIGSVIVVILSWVSYLFLFEKLMGLFVISGLYQPFFQSEKVKQIAILIRDLINTVVSLFGVGDFFFHSTKILFFMGATFWTLSSYLLPAAIMALFVWTIIIYRFINARRLPHVHFK